MGKHGTLPAKIVCGAYTYKVRHVTRLTNGDHVRLKGQAAHGDGEIRLDRGMTFQHQRETLLHEVLHAVEEERSLDLTENAVNQLSHGLAATLIANPRLTRLFLPGGDR